MIGPGSDKKSKKKESQKQYVCTSQINLLQGRELFDSKQTDHLKEQNSA